MSSQSCTGKAGSWVSQVVKPFSRGGECAGATERKDMY